MSNSFEILDYNFRNGTKIKCPYCNASVPYRPGDTCVEIIVSPKKCYQKPIPSMPHFSPEPNNSKSVFSQKDKSFSLEIKYILCPYCDKISAQVVDLDNDKHHSIYPSSIAQLFPNSVPDQISTDYYEACAILDASPKAAATLSRRCLQNMVRERWGVDFKTLAKEIEAIPNEKISDLERQALQAARKIGNIGAHPDMILDVSHSDAEMTIHIIELFLKKWYIDDPANEELLNQAIDVDKNNQSIKSDHQA